MAEAKIVIEAQIPAVFFTVDAYVDMMAICRSTKIEVGWLGLVERLPDIGKQQAFRIYKAIVPPQRLATGATCEILDGELLQQLIDTNRVEDIERIRFWAHSHHSMSTGPSGQDEAMGIECINQASCSTTDPGWYITAIFNHAGDINVGFYDYRIGVKLAGIRYKVEGLADVEERMQQAKAVLPNADDAMLRQLCQREIFANIEARIKTRIEDVKDFVDAQIKKQGTFQGANNTSGVVKASETRLAPAKRLPEEIDVRFYSSIKTKCEKKAYCRTFGFNFDDVEDMMKALSLTKPTQSRETDFDRSDRRLTKSSGNIVDRYYCRDGHVWEYSNNRKVNDDIVEFAVGALVPSELERFCINNGIDPSDLDAFPSDLDAFPSEVDEFREAVERDKPTTTAISSLQEIMHV